MDLGTLEHSVVELLSVEYSNVLCGSDHQKQRLGQEMNRVNLDVRNVFSPRRVVHRARRDEVKPILKESFFLPFDVLQKHQLYKRAPGNGQQRVRTIFENGGAPVAPSEAGRVVEEIGNS